MIKKILKGEVPLVIMYWILGIINALLQRFVFAKLFDNTFLGSTILYYLLFIFSFLYSSVVTIGIWNSATRYTQRGGNKVYGYWAKLSAILGAIGTLYIMVMFVNAGSAIDDKMLADVSKFNEQMPMKEDEYLTMTHAAYSDKVLTLYGTIDLYKSEAIAKKELDAGEDLAVWCNDPVIKKYTLAHIEMKFIFTLKDGTDISSYTYEKCAPYFN